MFLKPETGSAVNNVVQRSKNFPESQGGGLTAPCLENKGTKEREDVVQQKMYLIDINCDIFSKLYAP